MHTKIFSIILALAMLVGSLSFSVQTVSAAVTIVNGDFELPLNDDGTIPGWTFSTTQHSDNAFALVTGSYDESASIPPVYSIQPDPGYTNNGNFAVLVPSLPGVYSILSQPFPALSGDWIAGQACFGSEDYLPYDDNAQVLIVDNSGNVVATVFSASSSTVGGVRETGWVNWYYQFKAGGTYSIQARVTNVGDNMRSSILALDNMRQYSVPSGSHFSLNLMTVGNGTVKVAGSSLPADSNGKYPPGTIVTLTATPAPGNNFAGWSGNILSTSTSVDITMDSDKTIVGAFMPIMCTLTLKANGSGTVTAKAGSNDIISGSSLPWGTTVTLNGTPNVGWSFSNWSGGVTGTDYQKTVTLTTNLTVTGTFTQNIYTLNVNVTPAGSGTVVINPDKNGSYHYGDVIQLTATPATGYYFTGWSGNLGNVPDPEQNTIQVTIQGNTNITASFALKPTNWYTVSVSTIGNGSVTLFNEKTGLYIPSGASVEPGTSVRLAASPADGWSFTGWSGGLAGNANPGTLTINSNTNITASFVKINNQYTLTVNVAGSGTVLVKKDDGTIISNSSVFNSTQVGTYIYLFPSWNSGWHFASWSGPVALGSNISNNFVVLTNNDITVTANFEPTSGYLVTVRTTGEGTCSISPPSPDNIYQAGNQITITASPNVNDGYSFGYWSGDASGTINTFSTAINQDLDITANFVQNKYTLAVYPNGSGTVKGNYASSYIAGTILELTAEAAPGWHFSGWSGDAEGFSNTNPIQITMNKNMSVTANFAQFSYTVMVTQQGSGSVSKTPDYLSYAPGSSVTLTASPDSGWTFNHWTETYIQKNSAGSDLLVSNDSNSNPFVIDVNSDITIQAYFLQSDHPELLDSATAISPMENISLFGETVTFTSTVTDPSNSPITTGTVVFFDGSTPISGALSLDINGQASYSAADLGGGLHLITAQYSGDDSHNGSTSLVCKQIVMVNTNTTIVSTPNPSLLSQTVTFKAQVHSNILVSGIVKFSIDGLDKGFGTIDGSGLATLITADLTVGTHLVKATYTGDTYNKPSTSPDYQQLVQSNISVSLVSSNNPSVYGDSVTFISTVTSTVNIPTGSVVFYDGTSSLGNGGLNNSGQATLRTSTLSAGSHQITAIYSGDSNFPSAASPVLIQIVNPAPITRGYILSILKTRGGSVSVNIPGPIYAAGTSIQLTPKPDPGYSFVRWQGSLKGTADPAVLVMDSDKFVKAVFKFEKPASQGTQFVIWGGNNSDLSQAVQIGQHFMFWGAQWDKQVIAGDYPANASFKGFASSVDPVKKEWQWTTSPGNSCNPPDKIDAYITVIVSTHIKKTGNVISGNIAERVVIKVDDPAGYQSNPGHSGSGSVSGRVTEIIPN